MNQKKERILRILEKLKERARQQYTQALADKNLEEAFFQDDAERALVEAISAVSKED